MSILSTLRSHIEAPGNVVIPGTVALLISESSPSVVTTEHNFSATDTIAIPLTASDPTAIVSEEAGNTIELSPVGLSLSVNAPTIQAPEQPNISGSGGGIPANTRRKKKKEKKGKAPARAPVVIPPAHISIIQKPVLLQLKPELVTVTVSDKVEIELDTYRISIFTHKPKAIVYNWEEDFETVFALFA